MNYLYIRPNKDQHGFKPLGLSYLMARNPGRLLDTTFVDFGHKTNSEVRPWFKPVDYKVDVSKSELLEEVVGRSIDSFSPDVVYVSALTDEIGVGNKIVELLRKETDSPIIWGNWSTLTPEKLDADSVCRKYGIEYMSCNLDELPYLNWDAFDDRQFLKPYDGMVYRGGDFMIGHGCPGRCSYCINSTHPQKLKMFSVNRAISELNYLKREYHLGFWKFHDEDFLMKPVRWLKEFAANYDGTPFTCMVNPKTVTKAKARLLSDMSCVSASIGVESGSDPIREMLGRRESKEDIINGVRLLKENGIKTVAFNMIGLPYETEEAIIETIRLNAEAGIDVPNVSFFHPLPHTPLGNISVSNKFWKGEDFTQGEPSLDLPEISREKLKHYFKNFYYMVKEGI